MIITTHDALAGFLLDTFDKVPVLKENMEKMEIIGSLDESALGSFVASGPVLGVYVGGGTYGGAGIDALNEASLKNIFTPEPGFRLYVSDNTLETDSGLQLETIRVCVAVGCRNPSSAMAALGTGDDAGAWQYMEAVRQAISPLETARTNIRDARPVSWQPLVFTSELAVLGLDMDIRLSRTLRKDIDLEPAIYGAGYGEE
ncbi:MAG: hypothetical protein V6Z89_14575 [Desulfobacter sp.]